MAGKIYRLTIGYNDQLVTWTVPESQIHKVYDTRKGCVTFFDWFPPPEVAAEDKFPDSWRIAAKTQGRVRVPADLFREQE